MNWRVVPLHPGEGHEGPANVPVDELFGQGDEFLIAAIHGRGMYRCHPLRVVYADGDWIGDEDGCKEKPYNTIQEALDAASNGTAISIKRNVYAENPTTFSKRGIISVSGGRVYIE